MKPIACGRFWRSALVGLGCLAFSATSIASEPGKRPVNLLFIMTDQHRFDALSSAGNSVVKTPNFDRLAQEGVRFASAYTNCPVCVPARTTILTGHSPGSNKILSNNDINNLDMPNFPTFDQILIRHGYRGEYHGKYHSPYQLSLEYSQPVRWCTGKKAPAGTKADMSDADAFKQYVAAHVPERPLQPGELIANMYGRPYRPDPIDAAYGKEQRDVAQGTSYGCLDVPAEHTHTAYTAKEGLAALDRLAFGPFTLTVSIGPPHPPMVLAKPYYGMYPADKMPVSASIDDPCTNSPYRDRSLNEDPAYRDKAKLQYMVSDYYGLVTEVDDWVGRILRRLDELKLTDSTLVVFTSDHGELLGDHGMYSKFVFYEGSVHVPLLMRLPGAIPAGAVVKAPVSHVDLFATILDYCQVASPASGGKSLRGLIDGKEDGAARYVVSEWPATAVPGYMVFDGRWKLMFGKSAEARSLDALYDLKTDPQEVHNLIGANPDWEKHRDQAERLKGLLVERLTQISSPDLDAVKARPIARQPEPRDRKPAAKKAK